MRRTAISLVTLSCKTNCRRLSESAPSSDQRRHSCNGFSSSASLRNIPFSLLSSTHTAASITSQFKWSGIYSPAESTAFTQRRWRFHHGCIYVFTPKHPNTLSTPQNTYRPENYWQLCSWWFHADIVMTQTTFSCISSRKLDLFGRNLAGRWRLRKE